MKIDLESQESTCDDASSRESSQFHTGPAREGSPESVVPASSKIRIAWLASYPPTLLQPELTIVRSGKAHPATWIVTLAGALAKRQEIDLHVITASSGISKDQTVRKDGVTFHVIRHTFPFTVRGFPEYMRLDVVTRYAYLRRRVTQILLTLNPDVIHVHGTEYGYGLAALETKIPTIVSIQGIVNALAGVFPSSFYTHQAWIELNVIRNAKYFGIRTAWANNFVRNLNNRGTIYDLPEAVDSQFFNSVGRGPNQNILMVGSVLQRKGVEDALRAMSIVVAVCPSAKLLVVGEGHPNYIGQLKQRTKDAGVESNISWLGVKSAAEIAALHSMSTVLVHPTYLDNSPNAVAEAMASGLPVIASRVGGIPSMIENGATGLLIEPRNHYQLAEAVLRLLQNEAERKRLASRAREVAIERHFPSGVAEKTMNVYNDILAKESLR
jgi:glycosyltransferase involved in cell wall biosynthesis